MSDFDGSWFAWKVLPPLPMDWDASALAAQMQEIPLIPYHVAEIAPEFNQEGRLTHYFVVTLSPEEPTLSLPWMMLVQFDDSGYAAWFPPNWSFDVLPGEPVSHGQVWEVSRGDRLLKDNFETPVQAEYFSKHQDREAHRDAARYDDWVQPFRFEVRSVPVEGDRHAHY